MDSEYFESLVDKKGTEYLTELSLKYSHFYRVHTSMVTELKDKLSGPDLDNLLELEEIFNERIWLCVESYKEGMRTALIKATKHA
ncbi:hypothetical protein [Paenibacillus medicaginis]|uniref:Uncharacterized protein n=1 Tax=Paenibacillus medicaginis TaxID=1470560 RepID=A0ABV5C1C4_9BACL